MALLYDSSDQVQVLHLLMNWKLSDKSSRDELGRSIDERAVAINYDIIGNILVTHCLRYMEGDKGFGKGV